MTRSALNIVLNAGVISTLLLLSMIPLASAYESVDFWIAALGGILLGAGIAVAGMYMKVGLFETTLVTIFSYFVFGGVLVFREDALLGFIPGLNVLSGLSYGAFQVWKQALTLHTPFIGFAELQVAPYMVGLIASVIAVNIALRAQRYAFALIPVAMTLAFSVLYSTHAPLIPSIAGALIACITLGWLVWRNRVSRQAVIDHTDDEGMPTGTSRRSSSLPATAGVLITTLIAGAALIAIAPIERWVLRDQVVPPLEMHDYASPLTSFRKWVTDGEDTTLFSIDGLPEGATVRLATLDYYDGIVYQVSGSGGSGAGVFSRVGHEIENPIEGHHATVSVTVEDLGTVWLPTLGYLSRLTLVSDEHRERSGGLYYNDATGTAVLTTALQPGDRYEFDTVLPAAPTEAELAKADVAPIQMPQPAQVPDSLVVALEEVISDAETQAQQVRAVEAFFQTNGFFSSGLEGQVASRSGHGVGRQSDLFAGNQMIGDDEQYAVAMSLMLSQIGIPSRVVMGFSGDGGQGFDTQELIVTGDDVHAWVEVPFENLGWVPFWPTPAEDQVPTEEVPEQRQKPRAQVAQPPQTPQEPAELPPDPPKEAIEKGEEPEPETTTWLWKAIALGAAGLLLLCSPSLILILMRTRRRKKRARVENPANRLHGGWAELVDTAIDVGTPVAVGATRQEQGKALQEQYPESRITILAQQADEAVFGNLEPSADDIQAFWAASDRASAQLKRTLPIHKRIRAGLFPRSVLRKPGTRASSPTPRGQLRRKGNA